MKGEFSERLKEARQDKGWSQQELAQQMGMKNKASISRYESGEHKATTSIAKKFADILGVNVVWLIGYDDFKYIQQKHLDSKSIPIIGEIAAGKPILVQENVVGYETVEISENITYGLKVKGNSMRNARIEDGDIVYIRQQADVDSGDIAAVLIDGEDVTLKKVIKDEKGVFLMPENPEYKPMFFSKNELEKIHILGKVVYVKIKL